MSGRPPGTLVQEIVSWLYGWVDSRPEVTKASSPPSGRLARERYRSHAKDRFAAGSHFALRPMREVVTRRSMVWLTISGVNVLAVKEVMRPFLTTTLVHSGWPCVVVEIGVVGLVEGYLRIAQARVQAVEGDVQPIVRLPFERAGERLALLLIDDRAK